jgi:hypothetical protein
MIDMSTWEELVVDVVDDLHLDPNNVRIEQPEGVPEADIIHDLFGTEKAFALVEGIIKVGLLTHEVPIVVRRGKRLVVVEGNRRIAALKAIQNPNLAPDYKARITRLVQTHPDLNSLKRIIVKRAPSQDDADQLIAALHTGNQRVAWSPARQAAFFQAQIDAGKTPEQLLVQYPTINVKEFVVRSRILNLFRTVRYKDAGLVDYIKHRRFPVSTLARLYEYDKFREMAQIEVVDATATVVLRASQSEFSRLAEKIVSDIRSKRINTRTLNSTSSESYRAYMDELRNLLNEPVEDEDDDGTAAAAPVTAQTPLQAGGRGSSPPSSGSGSASPSTKDATTTPSASNGHSGSDERATPGMPEKPKKKRNYLNTETLEVPAEYPEAIRAILIELSSLNINRFPNAALDLLRTFLEKLIKAYAEAVNENIRNTSNERGFVQLGHCLIWLEGYLRTNSRTAYLQVIAKIRGNRVGDYIMSVDHMNAINHNHQIFATADEVRSCWDGMLGLVKVILKP